MYIITEMKPGRLWLHSHQEYLDPLKSGIDGNPKDCSPSSFTNEKSSEDESDSQSKIRYREIDPRDSIRSQIGIGPLDSIKSESDIEQLDHIKSKSDLDQLESIKSKSDIDPLDSIKPKSDIDPLDSIKSESDKDPLESIKSKSDEDQLDSSKSKSDFNPCDSIKSQIDSRDSIKPQIDIDQLDSIKSENGIDPRDYIKSQSDRPIVIPSEHHNKQFNLRDNFRKESPKDLFDNKDNVSNKENKVNSETHKECASIERSSSVIILCGQTPLDPSKRQGIEPLKLTSVPQEESLTNESCKSSLGTSENTKSSSKAFRDLKSSLDTHDDLKSPKISHSHELIKSLDPGEYNVSVRQASPASSLVSKVKVTSSQTIEKSDETITLRDLKVSKDSVVNRSESPEEQAQIQNSQIKINKSLLLQNNHLSINLKLTQKFLLQRSSLSALEEKAPLTPQSFGPLASPLSNQLHIRHSSLQGIESLQNFQPCSNPHSHQPFQSPKKFQAHCDPDEHEDHQSSKNIQELKAFEDPQSLHSCLMKDAEVPTEDTMISLRCHENEPLLKKRRILEPTEYQNNCHSQLTSNPTKINTGVGNEESEKISEKLEYNISLKIVSNKENGEPCDRSYDCGPEKKANESLNCHSSAVLAEEQKVPSSDHDSLSSEQNFMAKTVATVESNSTKEYRQLETVSSIKTSDSGINEIDGLVEKGTPEEGYKNSEFNEDERSEIGRTDQGESQDILAKACLAVGLDEEEFMCISEPYDETSQHHTSTTQIVNDSNRFLYPNTQWNQSEIQPPQNSHYVIRDDRCSRREENLSFATNKIKEKEDTNMNSVRYSVPYRFPYRMPYSVPANFYPHPAGARFRQASFHPNYPYSDPIYYNYQFPRNFSPSHPAYYPPNLVNAEKFQSADPSKSYAPYYRYPYHSHSGKANPSPCYPYDSSGIGVDTYKNLKIEPNGKPHSLPQQYNGFVDLESNTLHNKGPVGFFQPKLKPPVRPSMLPSNKAPKSRANCYSPARSPITPAIFPQSPAGQHPCTLPYENGRHTMNTNSHMFGQPSRNVYPRVNIQESSKEYCNSTANYAHKLPPHPLTTIPSSPHFSNETISNSNNNILDNSMNVQNAYYNYPNIDNSYSQEVCQGQYRQKLQNTSIPFTAPLPEGSEYYLSRISLPNHSSYIPQHSKWKNVPPFPSSYYPIQHKYRSDQICNKKESNKNNLNKESLPYVANYAGPFTIEQLQKERYPYPYSYTDWKVPTASQVEGHKIEKMRNPNYIAYQEEKVAKLHEITTSVQPQHDMQARDANVSSAHITNQKSVMQRPLNSSDHYSSESGDPRGPQATTVHFNGLQSSVSSKPGSGFFEQRSGPMIHNHQYPGHVPPVSYSNHLNSRDTWASSVIMETPNHLQGNNNSVISHTINQNPIPNNAKQYNGFTDTCTDRAHPTLSQMPPTSVSPHFSSPIISPSTPDSRQLPSCRYQKSSTDSINILTTQDRSFSNISESSSANELTSPYMNSSLLSFHPSELCDSTKFSHENKCQQSNSDYHQELSSVNIVSTGEKQNSPSYNEHSNSKSHYASCPGRIVYSSNHPRPSSEPTWDPCDKGHMFRHQDYFRPRPVSLPNQISIGPFILNKGFATYSISEKDEDEEEIFIFEQKFLPVIGHLLSLPEAANLRPYRENPDELLIHLVQLWGGEGAQSKLEEKYHRMKDNFMSVVKYLFEPHLLSLWGWDKAAPEQILDELIKPSDQGSLPRVVFAGRFPRHESSTASLESASDFLEDDVFLPGESMPDVFDCLDEIDHSSKCDPFFHCEDVKYLPPRMASDVVTSEVGSNHLKCFTPTDDKISRNTVCRDNGFDNDAEFCPHNTAQGADHGNFSNGDGTHIYSETLLTNSETSINSAHFKESCHTDLLDDESCNSDIKIKITSPKRITLKRPSVIEDDGDPFFKRQKLPSFKDVDVFPVEMKSVQSMHPLNNDRDKKTSDIKFEKAILSKVSKCPEKIMNSNEKCSSNCCKMGHTLTNEKCFCSICSFDESNKIPDVSIFKLDNHLNKPFVSPDKEPLMIFRSMEPDTFPKAIATLHEDSPLTQIEGNDNTTFEYSNYTDGVSSKQLSSFEPNNSEIKPCNIKKNQSAPTSNPRIFSFEALDDHINKLVESKSKFNSLKDEISEPIGSEVESHLLHNKSDKTSTEDFKCSTEAGKPVISDEVGSSSVNIPPRISTSAAAAFDWEELTKHLLQYKETLANKNSNTKVEPQLNVDEFRSKECLHAVEALMGGEVITVVGNDSIYEQQDVSNSSCNAYDESNHPRNEGPDLSTITSDLKSKKPENDDNNHVHACRDSSKQSSHLENQTFLNQNSVLKTCEEIKISTEWESRQTTCSNGAISTILDTQGNKLKNLHGKVDSTYLEGIKERQVKSIELPNSTITEQSVPDEIIYKNSGNIVNDQPVSNRSNLTTKNNDGKSNSSSSISNVQQNSTQTSTNVRKSTVSKVSGSDYLSKIRTTKKNSTSSPNKCFAGTTRDYNAIFQKYIETKLLSDQYGREVRDVIANKDFQ